MRISIAIVALLLTAAPAQAECRRDLSKGPVRLQRIERWPRDATRTRLVACDTRRGRAVVLARGHLETPFDRPVRGTFVGGGAAAGRRVAWVEASGGPRRMVARLHVVRVGRRVLPIGTSVVARFRPATYEPSLDAMITMHGDLAWLVPARRRYLDRVFVKRPGRRPRPVATGAFSDIALEDGRTLRLGGEDANEFRYVDLHPQREPRCGGRSRFRTVLETDMVVVTKARYRSDGVVGDAAIRVCLRATGRDPAVISTVGEDDERLDAIAADGPWVVITDVWCWKECLYATFTFKAGSGRLGGRYGTELLPHASLPLAVNDAGVAAWVAGDDGMAKLVAAGRVIDTGAPGSIASLDFTGTRLTWTKDGVPKSAEISPPAARA